MRGKEYQEGILLNLPWFASVLQCGCKRATKGLQECVYPEPEAKIEGCDKQEVLKKESGSWTSASG